MLSGNSEFLNNFNPVSIANNVALRAKQLRLSKNYTQALLASQSGVSLGSLKRFERSGEISLQNLLRLAIVLNATDAFKDLFTIMPSYKSVDEVLKLKENSSRKRGSKKS